MQKQARPQHYRNEMLGTTVEDIRSCAALIDELVSQMRVFAVLGKSAADNARFDFAYYADSDTLTVTPRFKKNLPAYSDNAAPGEYITRAEIDRIISDLIADEREIEYIDLSSPEEYITRASFAAVMAGFIFKPESTLEAQFSDMKEDDWFYAPMSAMVNAGYIKGYGDNTMRPESFITRAEVQIIINRMIEG